MNDRFEAPYEFVYPSDGLFNLQGILLQEEICTPNNQTPGEESYLMHDQAWINYAYYCW